jgi:hypothetical protein
MDADSKKKAAALAALDYLEDGTTVGVGTGSTVNHFIAALASRRHRIAGAVSSSDASTKLLREAGVEVRSLNDAGDLALYVDGADEATRHLALIKGGGGALTREKIVAAASRSCARGSRPTTATRYSTCATCGLPTPLRSRRRSGCWRASSKWACSRGAGRTCCSSRAMAGCRS